MTIDDILKDAVLISEEASFKDAVESMITHQTNSLLVTNVNGTLVGEVSVTDLLDAIVPEYLDGDSIAAHFASGDMFAEAVKDSAEQQVKFFMDRNVTTITDTEGLMAIASAAINNKKARIPVVDGQGRPIGIISRRGLKHIIADSLGITHS